MNNIVTAVFGGFRETRTRPIWQWDYGMRLRFVGPDLPASYTVHQANEPLSGSAKTRIGDDTGVDILDEYLTTGKPVYVWLYLHTGEADGETVYMVTIPVTPRPRPVEDPPTPVQQGLIEQALRALDAGVETAESAAQTAQSAAETAEGAAELLAHPTAEAVTLEPGSQAQASYANGVFTFGIPQGEKGDKGDKGETGATGAQGPKGDTGNSAIVAPDYANLTFPVSAGQHCIYNSALYVANQDIATSETWTAAHWNAVTVGDEIGELKSALHDFGATSADWADSDAEANTGKEVYATDDPVGAVNNGYINTKQTNGAYIVVPVNEGETIKVSGRAKDSYPILSYFNSSEIGKTSYVSTPVFVTTGTNYHDAEFVVPTGDGITHAVINTSVQSDTPAKCKKLMPSNFVSHLYEAGYAKQSDLDDLSGDVDDMETAIESIIRATPTIITVKTDGSGDFTNLKAAVNSIVDSSESNPYEIHIYEGTYNVLSDYTPEEIDQAYTPSSTYTDETFVGVKLQDGVSLVGIGNRDRIILNGELSTSDWGKDWRKNISTLNMKGNGRLENVTLIANNLRYCLHDDLSFSSASGTFKRTLKNVIMRIGNTTNYNPGITYGAGMASGGMIGLFEDCDFSQSFGIHSNRGAVKSEIIMKNCKGWKALFADYGVTDVHINMYNCDFAIIELADSGLDHVQRMFVSGVGNEDCVAMAPTGWIYNLGCVAKSKKLNLTTGTAVKVNTVIQGLNNDSSFRQYVPTDDKDLFYGIVIGEDSYFTYIQHSGYIMGNKTNLSDVNVGDYVGVTTDGALTIVASKSDAIGCVVMVDQSNDFVIKL